MVGVNHAAKISCEQEGRRERHQWSGCVGCMAEGAVDQGQGPSIMGHGGSLRADVPCFHGGCPLGGNTGLFTTLQTVPHSLTH